jgi:phospholipase/carboxylesterase
MIDTKQGKTILAAMAIIGCLLATGAVASSPPELEAEAIEAMEEGDYGRASLILERLLERQPDNPRVLFNLACCLSRLGALGKAGERLEQAWQAGLQDPELLRDDPDLEALRSSKKGSALINRLASEAEQLMRLRGMPHFFEARTLGGLRVVAPRKMEEGRRYPLVLILHGHGANPELYAGLFEYVETELGAIVCAPYGPYPIFLEQGRGYSWYPAPWLYQEVLARGGTADDRPLRRREIEEREQAVSYSYVQAAIEEVKARYPVDPEQVYVLGHSEGGVLAYGLAMRNPDTIKGLVVVGSRLREVDSSADLLSQAAGKLQVLICHSREDQMMAFEAAKSAHAMLKKAGIRSKLVAYEGGHGITSELVKIIARWIESPGRRETKSN